MEQTEKRKEFDKCAREYIVSRVEATNKISLLFLAEYLLKNGMGNILADGNLYEELEKAVSRLPQISNEDSYKNTANEIQMIVQLEMSDIPVAIYDKDSDFRNICNQLDIVRTQLEKAGKTWALQYMEPDNVETVHRQDIFIKEYTEKMNADNVPAVYERPELLRRLTDLLSSGDNKGVLITGANGTGKRSLIYTLVHALEKDTICESLKDHQVLKLNINNLFTNDYRNEKAIRLSRLLEEMEHGKYILFIDNINDLSDTMFRQNTLLNNLKNAVSRGTIKVVATLPEQFAKEFNTHAVMSGVMNEISLQSPTRNQTLSILKFVSKSLQEQTGISTDSHTLTACYDLTDKFIKNGVMPDKAVSVLKQAVYAVHKNKNTPPQQWHQQQDRIRELEESIEFTQEEDRSDIERKLGLLKQESNILHQQWQKEQEKLLEINNIEQEKSQLLQEADYFKRNGQIKEYGELINFSIPQVEKKIQSLYDVLGNLIYCRNHIKESDIRTLVSQISGIPIADLGLSEKARLLSLKDNLKEKVIGQDNAIEKVSATILRSKSGLSDPNRPYGSFLFLGTTGVGKTLLCEELARFLFGNPNAMIRLDMSEYSEDASVTRLIGAPPGYIGFDDGGTLTEEVKKNPYSIVLLDEMEKAHPKVLNLFLQVMDKGILTDSRSNVVDFKNTLIIMTSNVGAEDIMDLKGQSPEDIHQTVVDTLKETFAPEFLNRIDELVVFDALTPHAIKEICRLQLAELENRLQSLGMSLNVSDEVVEFLAKEGFDEEWGARPMRRMIQRLLIDPIAEKLIADQYKKGDCVNIGISKKQILID